MRLTLMHNPKAGSGGHAADELRAALEGAGYDVTYGSTEDGDGARLLDRPTDLVVAAGGDGTVAQVAKWLVGRDVPLAILPLGTANNIARSLDVQGSADDLIAGLRAERLPALARRRLDVGTARAPWGESRFVESAGVGLLGAMLRDAEAGGDAGGVAAGRRCLRRVLDRMRPRHWDVEADGVDLSGSYLMVEVVNTRYVGPRVALAPAAGAPAGELHLVLLREDDRRAFDAYLARDPDDADGDAPVSTRLVRRVHVAWRRALGHVDDEPWPEGSDDRADDATGPDAARADGGHPLVEIEIVDRPITVLAPSGR